jgi:hypothetical protein
MVFWGLAYVMIGRLSRRPLPTSGEKVYSNSDTEEAGVWMATWRSFAFFLANLGTFVLRLPFMVRIGFNRVTSRSWRMPLVSDPKDRSTRHSASRSAARQNSRITDQHARAFETKLHDLGFKQENMPVEVLHRKASALLDQLDR